MGGDDQRDSVILSRENSAPVTVPSVAMYNLRVDASGVEIGRALHGAECGTEWLWTIPVSRIQLEPAHGEIARGVILIAKTANFHRYEFCQLARQIFDVHAGAAVGVGRVFICEKKHLHPATY